MEDVGTCVGNVCEIPDDSEVCGAIEPGKSDEDLDEFTITPCLPANSDIVSCSFP